MRFVAESESRLIGNDGAVDFVLGGAATNGAAATQQQQSSSTTGGGDAMEIS